MNPDISEVIKVFVYGVLTGSGPCLLSCGPFFLSIILLKAFNWKSGLFFTISYLAGKVIAYIFISLLAVLTIRLINNFIQDGYIKVVSGIFIISLGVIHIIKRRELIECRYLNNKLSKKSFFIVFSIGFILGLSPCIPVSGVAVYISAIAKNIFDGLLYGFAFGVGTCISPLLIVGVFTGKLLEYLKDNIKAKYILRLVSAVTIIIMGILLILK